MSAPGRALVVVALVAAVLGYRWWSSPERQIRRVLHGIADRLSHDRPLDGLAAVGALAGLRDDLSPDVAIEAGDPLPPLSGREAVLAAAARLASGTPAFRLEVADERIAMGADGTSAAVACSLVATIRDGAGRETMDARDVTIDMRLVNGRWVVERAAALAVLEPVT